MLALLASACSRAPTEQASPATPASVAEHAPIHYTVTVAAERPLLLDASLDLDEFAGSGRTAHVQGTNFGLVPQVGDVRCDGQPVEQDGQGHWPLPDLCRQLEWTIAVREAEPMGVDASAQASLYFPEPGWWLLSEPTSLLRVSAAPAGRGLAVQFTGLPESARQTGGQPSAGGGWRVPPFGSAPEFYAFGVLHSHALDFETLQVTYVADDPAAIERLPLEPAHRSILKYLLDTFPVTADQANGSHLLVIWLGVDEAHGHAGGAAGSRSFLANYVVGDAGNDDLNAVRTLMILAHEQVHQLVDLFGPSAPISTWASESLAQYYGLTALRHSPLAATAVERAHAFFIDPVRPVEAGLRTLQARHEAGDADAYDLFYTQGATFWSEVDRVLREAGSPDGLDALLPMLLGAGFEGVDLPAEVRAELVRRGGAEIEAVLARYL
jgi:hypothetical protein